MRVHGPKPLRIEPGTVASKSRPLIPFSEEYVSNAWFYFFGLPAPRASSARRAGLVGMASRERDFSRRRFQLTILLLPMNFRFQPSARSERRMTGGHARPIFRSTLPNASRRSSRLKSGRVSRHRIQMKDGR